MLTKWSLPGVMTRRGAKPDGRSSMRRQLTLKVLGALSLALLAAAPLLAQTQFASFTGTVHSKDGNPVPNVEVAATNVATQVKLHGAQQRRRASTRSRRCRSALQDPRGGAGLPGLRDEPDPPGVGPERARRHPDAARRLGERRGHGRDPDPADPGRGRRRGHLGGTIQSLPLNGRNFSQLSLLLPGVITWNPDSFTEPKNFGSGRPMVNGQREQANNYLLDGVDMNEVIDNLLPYQPNTDALAEVRVDTNNVSAEYGNVAGARHRQHDQVGNERVPRLGLRVLARQQHGRELAGTTTASSRRRRKPTCPSTSSARRSAARSSRTSCSSSATTRASSGTGRASWSARWRPRPGGRATSRASA